MTEGGCVRQLRDFAIDALTPLGATAEQVLEPLLGTHTAPLLWSSNTGALTIGPEQGLSQIELTATYAGGRVAWAHFLQDSAESGGAASTLGCPVDRLEIELDWRLRTSGGALDERFVAALAAPAVDDAQLMTNLPFDELAGSFFVMAPPGTSVGMIQVTALWDALGFRGSLMGGVELIGGRGDAGAPNALEAAGASVGFGFVPFAEWPPAAGNAGP